MTFGLTGAALGGAIIAGGTVASSAIGALGATSAAGTQADAANNATNAQLSMFNTEQKNVAPFISSGTNALNVLNQDLGLTSSPNTAGSGGFVPNTTATYSGDPTQAITQMYQNLLGRAPDPQGLQTWLAQAASGVPLAQIAQMIQQTPEYQQKSTTPGTGQPAPGSPLALTAFGTTANGLTMPTYGGTINGLTGPQNFGAAQYQQSPGYQWQLSQGLGAISNAASATGGINGGNTLKALQTYGQGLANQDFQQAYNNYATNYGNVYNSSAGNYANAFNSLNNNANTNFNRLNALATGGLDAAAGINAQATTVGNKIGANIIGAGDANAAGIVGTANAGAGGLNSLASLLNNPQYAFLLGGSGGGYGNPLAATGGGVSVLGG